MRGELITSVQCPLCSATAEEIVSAYPGYKKPTAFRIMECAACRVQFANPLRSDPELYDAIYRQPALMPGYDRYYGFAKAVEKSSKPLDFLAGSMEPYWAVRHAIRNVRPGAQMLDVGSGLGYLAYALASAGYKATGLDISENAVVSARARFGNRYVVADMFDWSQKHVDHYDVVTMLEVVEHVEEPRRWIEAAFHMVKPGGMLIVTTPNRDFYVNGSIWATEAPPVHLWWFSPQSFVPLTQGLDAETEIVDFRDCEFKPAQAYSDEPWTAFRTPMLDAQGRPSSFLKRASAALGLLPVAKAIWATLYGPKDRGLTHPDPGVRETLAVVLRKSSYS